MITNYLVKSIFSYPNKNAVIVDDKFYTYAKLADDLKCLIQLLKNLGIKRHSHVLILLENSYEFVLMMLALADIGAVLVPINTTMGIIAIEKTIQTSDIEYIVGLSNAICKYSSSLQNLVDSKKWLLKGEKLYDSHIFEEMENYRNSQYILGMNDGNEDNAYILSMTSGSTGDPKPIIFSQRTKINRSIRSAKEVYNLDHNDIIIASSPMYHSLAQRLVLLPLLIGGTSVILKKFNPLVWLKAVERYHVTFTILVSSNLELLLNKIKEQQFDLHSLKTIVSSSALLKPHIKNECIQEFQADFHEMYGASEIGTATNLFPEDAKVKMNSVGRPLNYVDLKIVDEVGCEVSPGIEGEIICKTITKFSGYYKNDSATSNSIKNNYFYTGDLGYVDEDGFLYFRGRKKEVINVGGALVYPRDIEDVINNINSVEECAVVGIEDMYFGEIVLAVIVPKAYEEFNLAQIKLECRTILADFQQPMAYEIIDVLPKNGMGKIMKQELKKRFINYDASKLLRKILK